MLSIYKGGVQMEISVIRAQDYSVIYDILSQVSHSGIRVEDDYDGFERFLLRNPNSNFVARVDNRIVGILIAGHDGRRGHIYHTAVLDPNRSRTIGKALLDALYEAFAKESVRKVGVLVDVDNDAGHDFFTAHGFLRRDDLDYFDHIAEL